MEVQPGIEYSQQNREGPMKRKLFVMLTTMALLCPLTMPVFACGPFIPEDTFSFSTNPDLPLKSYATGNLGVIRPTFAKSYLVVAYRYLVDKPLSAEEQMAAYQLWKSRINYAGQFDNAALTDAWTAARRKVPGLASVTVDPQRRVSSDDPYGEFYTNCNASSFASAAKLLDEKIARHGLSSNFVKDWVNAQDLVFCHCSGGSYNWNKKANDPEPAFPKPAQAQADAEEKYDRQYQLAAAKFYAQNFDASLADFKQIAAEAASPYASLAAYMIARCYLRKATLTKMDHAQFDSTLDQARTQLNAIMANPALSALHEDCRELIGFIAFRLKPGARLNDLAATLTAGGKAKNFEQNLDDYTLLLDKLEGVSADDAGDGNPPAHPFPETAGKDDLSDWITVFQANDKSRFDHALDRWHHTHSAAWLIAALHLAPADKAKVSELLAASQSLLPGAPGYFSANYESRQWKVANQPGQALEKELTTLAHEAEAKHLPSAQNLLMDLRQLLPMNIDSFIENAVRRPAALAYDLDYFEDEFAEDAKAKKRPNIPFAFDAHSALLMNLHMPLSVLVQAASSTRLPANLRADLAQAAWVRAVILADEPAQTKLSPLLATAIPSLAPLLKRSDLGSAEQRKFSAVYLILKNPGMQPYITAGALRDDAWDKLNTYNDNWWGDTPGEGDNAGKLKGNEFPGLLTKEQLAKGAEEENRVVKAGSGPTYLANQVVSYAQANKTDARIPEALYLAVRATHYGFRDARTTAASKQAFQLLHKEYPKNPFTVKTKFHY